MPRKSKSPNPEHLPFHKFRRNSSSEPFMQPELFLIDGRVSMLKTGATSLNLLAPKQNLGNAAAGVIGAATDQYGTAANAAMVANYEGEEVDNFACYVGEQLIHGTFSRVFFEDGVSRPLDICDYRWTGRQSQ